MENDEPVGAFMPYIFCGVNLKRARGRSQKGEGSFGGRTTKARRART